MRRIFKKVMSMSLSLIIMTTILAGFAIAQTTKTLPAQPSGILTGACVIRDGKASLPGYHAADSGTGYAMKKMGNVQDYNDIKRKCTDTVYQQITSLYCQNTSKSGQWQAVLYDNKGNLKTMGCAQSGCDYHACPVEHYGACVIRDGKASLPGYNAADSGKGYAMKKMGKVKDYNDIKLKCVDTIYRQITSLYCQNTSKFGQWQVALYDIRGNNKTEGCAQSGCKYHSCPVK